MTPAPVLRPAVRGDASDLAILLDAASRRLVSYLWNGMAVSGQSVFEVGRARILMNTQSPSYHANWQVAELDGQIAGGLAGYVMEDPYDPAIADDYPAAFRPMFELEAVAAGTWYLQVVALFAEYRGMGLGQILLDRADAMAVQAGRSRITLITESFNVRAIAAYLRHGYREWDRRTFIPFAGTDEEGDWLLMVKDL